MVWYSQAIDMRRRIMNLLLILIVAFVPFALYLRWREPRLILLSHAPRG